MKQIQLIAACLFIQLCFTTRISSSHPLFFSPLEFFGGGNSQSAKTGENLGRAFGSLASLPLDLTKQSTTFLTSTALDTKKNVSDMTNQLLTGLSSDASGNTSAKGVQKKDSNLFGSLLSAPLGMVSNTIEHGSKFVGETFGSMLDEAEKSINLFGQFNNEVLKEWVIPLLQATGINGLDLKRILQLIGKLQKQGIAYAEPLLEVLGKMGVKGGMNINV